MRNLNGIFAKKLHIRQTDMIGLIIVNLKHWTAHFLLHIGRPIEGHSHSFSRVTLFQGSLSYEDPDYF